MYEDFIHFEQGEGISYVGADLYYFKIRGKTYICKLRFAYSKDGFIKPKDLDIDNLIPSFVGGILDDGHNTHDSFVDTVMGVHFGIEWWEVM